MVVTVISFRASTTDREGSRESAQGRLCIADALLEAISGEESYL